MSVFHGFSVVSVPCPDDNDLFIAFIQGPLIRNTVGAASVQIGDPADHNGSGHIRDRCRSRHCLLKIAVTVFKIFRLSGDFALSCDPFLQSCRRISAAII